MDFSSESSWTLAALIDGIPDGVILVDPEGTIREWNRSMAELSETPAKEVAGKKLWDVEFGFLPTDERNGETYSDIIDSFQKTGGGPETDDFRRTYERYYTLPSGKRKYIQALLFPLDLPGGLHLCGVLKDITDQRRLQEQLFQSQKLEAIGKLTGGIAHDFNNMLTVIQGFTRFMLREEDPDSKRFVYLQEIDKASVRAAGFINQLLAFSRRQVLDLEPTELNHLAADSISMLKRLIGEHIDLYFFPAEGPTTVMADHGQIIQILMNLTVNSRDAMPAGGKLVIQLRAIELNGPVDMGGYTIARNRYVEVLVADNGQGMTDDIKGRILEPFFSSKGSGKGTGLGLSTSYGIVKQLKGYLLYESEKTRGSVFSILLPTTRQKAGEAETAPGTVLTFSGNETILLAEDDYDVRKIISLELQSAGYTVLEASDGEEALDIYRKSRPDIIVSDVVMPRVDGIELAKRLSGGDPGLRIVFLSGYPDGRTLKIAGTGFRWRFIQKPVIPQLLLKTVRELLDTEDMRQQ